MKKLKYRYRNLFTTLMILTIFSLLLSACAGGTTSNTESNTSTDNDNEVFHLRMNSVNAPSIEGSPQTIAETGFADLVKERTNGRIEIEIFYSNQLAGQTESLDALARGTYDLQVTAPAFWADKIPEGDWSSIPFGWTSEEDVRRIIRETEFGKLYEEALLEYGVRPLHYYFSGDAGYLSTVPISNPKDMNGIVFNSVSTLKANYYKEMGAGISSIAAAEYYEGLLRGTFDAVLFPFYAMETMKLAEVVDYVTVPGEVAPAPTLIAISEKTWNKLPGDLQNILKEVALEIEEQTMAASKEFTERGLKYAEDNGVDIIELSDEDKNAFVKIAQETVWDKFAEVNERTAKMVEILKDNANK